MQGFSNDAESFSDNIGTVLKPVILWDYYQFTFVFFALFPITKKVEKLEDKIKQIWI